MGKVVMNSTENEKGVKYIKNSKSSYYDSNGLEFEEMLTPDEVQKRLYIGRTKVYELLKTKEIKSLRIGRVYRVSEEALQSYIKACEAEE